MPEPTVSGIKFDDAIVKGSELYIDNCWINCTGVGTYLGVAVSDIYLNEHGRKTVVISYDDVDKFSELLYENCNDLNLDETNIGIYQVYEEKYVGIKEKSN